MGPVSPRLHHHYPRLRYSAILLLIAGGLVSGVAAGQTANFDFGDGRHGSITLPPGETTVQDLWSQVRSGADATAYDPAEDDQVPSLENLTISSGGTLTVTGFTGNPGSTVDPVAGGVLRIKVRGTLTIEAGAEISATGKGYRGGTLEGAAPGRIGQQGDSWGNGGAISGDSNRGGGGGGFGEINNGNNPGSGGGGGHREAGARGATGQGTQTGGFGGDSFDTVATDLGQGFRDQFPFPRFGSGGGRGGQVANFTNVGATGGTGGGIIIIEAQTILNEGTISADGGVGGSDLSGGGGGAGGSILIQTLTTANGTVTVEGGAGGAGTVLGNDGGAGGSGIVVWDTRFELETAVEGEGTVTLSPPGGRYSENAEVELTAVPEVGWTFDHWEGDLTGNTNPEELTIDGAKSVTAFFVELPTLAVTPLTREIGPSGGDLSFGVEVTGGAGDIAWTSTVETGLDFISINSGASGVNDGAISVTIARNMIETSRTGTIAVASEDTGGDPIVLTITQGPATPVLSVAPAEVTAEAEGDELVIQVRNDGTGTFDWTASILTGHGFASITSAATGTDDGTFVVTLEENPSALQRTATLSVSAPGALNSPAEVRITQQAGVPLLQVTPSAQTIGSAAGTASLSVVNGGNGTMNWTASVIDGGSFASITSGSSGSNAGLVSVALTANTTQQNRTATIRVETVDAANSPVDVTITQTAQEAVLLVSPETQSVGSGAGTASFQVQNTGSGTMAWTAAVLTGANFVTINSGVSGTNSGTILLNVTENATAEARTATLRVAAPGAANSPQTVTLVQESRTPVLRIVPAQQSIGSGGGAVNITIENGGTGAMSWTAALDSGAEFLSITAPSSGIDDGTVQVVVAPNATGENRTGTVRIEAPGALDSPQTATIVQLGCVVLDQPENLAASDGIFADSVELIWSAVPGAVSYEIYRGPVDFPGQTELIGTSDGPRYSDELAEEPEYELVNRGCFNPGEFIITYVIYSYAVKAINPCGAGELSAPTTGYRGLPRADGEEDPEPDPEEPTDPVVVPTTKSTAGQSLLQGGEVALRLHAADGIDPETVWAQVDGIAADPTRIYWRPVFDGDHTDGWIVVGGLERIADGTQFTVDAGARTLTGESIAASQDWVRAAGETDKSDAVVMPYLMPEEEDGQFMAGIGDVYEIGPAAVYAEPMPIQIPVPQYEADTSLTLYYYLDGEQGGWYRAENVSGWLAAPVTRSADGSSLEALVNHGGIVRVGRVEAQAVPVSKAGSVLPLDFGTLAVLAATALALVLLGRRRAHREPGR